MLYCLQDLELKVADLEKENTKEKEVIIDHVSWIYRIQINFTGYPVKSLAGCRISERCHTPSISPFAVKVFEKNMSEYRDLCNKLSASLETLTAKHDMLEQVRANFFLLGMM